MEPAVVIGSGRSVWSDLRALQGRTMVPFVVNDMVVYAPRVRHAVSHHGNKLVLFLALRGKKPDRTAREKEITTHSSADYPGVDRAWPEFRSGGSSTLLAVRIALALGHADVWVAGVPLDRAGYIWSDPEEPRGSYDFAAYRSAWEKDQAALRERGVRGVSGYLAELLGTPNLSAWQNPRVTEGMSA